MSKHGHQKIPLVWTRGNVNFEFKKKVLLHAFGKKLPENQVYFLCGLSRYLDYTR
jgi:hypothetical protein